eukprot:CAMPEP_0175028638 /NCGR_PEP_ID=MMETSP0005-20121125/19123_1 /TAXON_ID=420556 /ORGANISM="Ochromonas sp., Strain CCMP1393" /LENGTH=59 /DNA_ID=CAMNT_0016288303 /DNA_START=245 /DNA_END=424 /DNA_ORIENTATION=+
MSIHMSDMPVECFQFSRELQIIVVDRKMPAAAVFDIEDTETDILKYILVAQFDPQFCVI